MVAYVFLFVYDSIKMSKELYTWLLTFLFSMIVMKLLIHMGDYVFYSICMIEIR